MKTDRFLSKVIFPLLAILLILSFSACSNNISADESQSDLGPIGEQSLVNIPGGLMLAYDGGVNPHPVMLYDFQIQSQLVTAADYAKCVESGACEPAGESGESTVPAAVNWYQAQAYCESIGGRLPTEAELTKVSLPAEVCTPEGYQPVYRAGYGEWVYDWDDPDFYNRSLVTNPFGPVSGDLKLILGLNLGNLQSNGIALPKLEDQIGDVFFKSREVEFKVETSDGGFSIITEGSEIKVDPGAGLIKPVPANDDAGHTKFFTQPDENAGEGVEKPVPANDDTGGFAKFFGQIGESIGKFFTKDDWGTQDFGKFFNQPNENAGYFPRLGVLPDQSSPLIGFRCVAQGMALTYAPICKQTYAAYCSPPDGQMQPLIQESSEAPAEPNFTVVGASCPVNGRVIITIGHDLPSGEGVEVFDSHNACYCE
ncbi:MAG: SUMF1/EgtB/PvdO family nonheme iron enzyme, partial [Chloroflexota bacterium]